MNTEYVHDDPYTVGDLHQRCSKCQWWQSGHGLEVKSCPLCGAPTDPRVAIEFGGVVVEFDGTQFKFGNALGVVTVFKADYPDVITFMLRHAVKGPMRPSPGAKRRIASGVGDYRERHPRTERIRPR
jgi:hypothetical protein